MNPYTSMRAGATEGQDFHLVLLDNGKYRHTGENASLPFAPTLCGAEAVVTSCALAIAETGTIVLDHGPGQGRRALCLIPGFHLIILRFAQIVHRVPDAIGLLDPAHPQTWIGGPSATSDIEFTRIEGVHGPRRLQVILVR